MTATSAASTTTTRYLNTSATMDLYKFLLDQNNVDNNTFKHKNNTTNHQKQSSYDKSSSMESVHNIQLKRQQQQQQQQEEHDEAKRKEQLYKRVKQWLYSFRKCDPRYQILTFFELVAQEGIDNIHNGILNDEIKKKQQHQHYQSETSLAFEDALKRIQMTQQQQVPARRVSTDSSSQPSLESSSVFSSLDESMTSLDFYDSQHDNDNSSYHQLQLSQALPTLANNQSQQMRRSSHIFNLNHESFSSVETLRRKSSLMCFNKSSVFTIWRPTSNDAIRKMMLREGVGKGLDIKGKSAKTGILSGYVPFLQIHQEQHKTSIGTLPKGSKIRIYYQTHHARDVAIKELTLVANEMIKGHAANQRIIHENSLSSIVNEDELEAAMSHYMWDIDGCTSIEIIDDYQEQDCYGIELEERVFWEAYVFRKDISRIKGSKYDTGRPSMPEFQDMNFASLRAKKQQERKEQQQQDDKPKKKVVPPRTVVWQYSSSSSKQKQQHSHHQDDEDIDIDDDPMCPLTLLMAYEQNGCVLPVVSDFDCFLVGTKRVQYSKPMPTEQVHITEWSIQQIESVLHDHHHHEQHEQGQSNDENDDKDKNKNKNNKTNNQNNNNSSWTSCWLNRMKENFKENGYKDPIKVPSNGFGDPTSNQMMDEAIDKLSRYGSVRHGSECFNYYFPQEIDESSDKFLVISNDVITNNDNNDNDLLFSEGLPWKYMNVIELQQFLSNRIDDGYTFPLNPKWILCDGSGKWKQLYDKLCLSNRPNVQESLNVWYGPKDSSIRNHIESISNKYPNGFIITTTTTTSTTTKEEENRNNNNCLLLSSSRTNDGIIDNDDDDENRAETLMDLAQRELRRYMVIQRAKRKLRAIVRFMMLTRPPRSTTTTTTTRTTTTETSSSSADGKKNIDHNTTTRDNDKEEEEEEVLLVQEEECLLLSPAEQSSSSTTVTASLHNSSNCSNMNNTPQPTTDNKAYSNKKVISSDSCSSSSKKKNDIIIKNNTRNDNDSIVHKNKIYDIDKVWYERRRKTIVALSTSSSSSSSSSSLRVIENNTSSTNQECSNNTHSSTSSASSNTKGGGGRKTLLRKQFSLFRKEYKQQVDQVFFFGGAPPDDV